jgi:succinate dehydrogenase/fumarate reductase flavoprotein subunit
MSGFDVIILIITIVVIAAVVGAFVTNGQKSLKEMKEDYYNNEEAQEVVKLTQELYNKDLCPIVAKKAPKEVKETKSEIPTEQPAKKKRKYYPKKKKTEGN